MPAAEPYFQDSSYNVPQPQRIAGAVVREMQRKYRLLNWAGIVTPGRHDIIQWLIRRIGLGHHHRLSIGYISSRTGRSDDTVLRALDDMEALGNLKRHHILRTDNDGRPVQDVSFLELIPDTDGTVPQKAEEKWLAQSSHLVLAARKLKSCKKATRTKKRRRNPRESPARDEADAVKNRDRQIAAMTPPRKPTRGVRPTQIDAAYVQRHAVAPMDGRTKVAKTLAETERDEFAIKRAALLAAMGWQEPAIPRDPPKLTRFERAMRDFDRFGTVIKPQYKEKEWTAEQQIAIINGLPVPPATTADRPA